MGWKKEISNLYSVNIVIWNDGRDYLDKSHFSSSEPIRLTYSNDTHVLFHKFSHTSRKNLKLQSIEIPEDNSIKINISDDEALEKGDGGILNILYSGSANPKFLITGRIKGVPGGFAEIEWSDVVSKSLDLLFFITLFLLIIELVGGVLMFFWGIICIRKKESNFLFNLYFIGGGFISYRNCRLFINRYNIFRFFCSILGVLTNHFTYKNFSYTCMFSLVFFKILKYNYYL